MVSVQFRGKTVVLHHKGNTATIDRKDFKEFIAANKRHRKRMKRPQLKLVVNNKIQDTVQEEAA